jgi:putative ABC transport system ATP-binding protein
MTASDQPLLRLEGVTKVFLTDEVETHALSGIHMEIKKGEYISIAGPSGCGKSTLLSILGLLDSPTDGSYWLAGKPVADLPPSERARVETARSGSFFRVLISSVTSTCLRTLSCLSPIEASRRPSAKRSWRRWNASAWLIAQSIFQASSGGQQQRVAVARAVAGDPLILLADEPTGNLDSTNGEAVMELLRELHGQGATVCMVTHDPRYARHADRQVHLFDGRVVDEEHEQGRARVAGSGFEKV